MTAPTLDELQRIETFLTHQGWPVTRLGATTLRSSFRAEKSTFPLVAQIEDGWVKLMVLPIARMPGDPVKAEQLYERLLKLNGQIMLARFSLDEDGDVLLSVEFPIADLDDSELQDSLDVLTYYAAQHQPEIRGLTAIS